MIGYYPVYPLYQGYRCACGAWVAPNTTHYCFFPQTIPSSPVLPPVDHSLEIAALRARVEVLERRLKRLADAASDVDATEVGR